MKRMFKRVTLKHPTVTFDYDDEDDSLEGGGPNHIGDQFLDDDELDHLERAEGDQPSDEDNQM